ncbi:MAG: hypothetical protein N2513_08305 [Deltaproteobacteria bacterium]|nr:hypothetical protein [Deltaproteobacteria bacterium]
MKPCLIRSGEDGDPVSIKFNGRWLKINWICKRWRIKKDWWNKEKEREYFQIETEEGLLCEIFQDLKNGLWFIERIYD